MTTLEPMLEVNPAYAARPLPVSDVMWDPQILTRLVSIKKRGSKAVSSSQCSTPFQPQIRIRPTYFQQLTTLYNTRSRRVTL